MGIIWIERNDNVFNQEQWYEPKAKHHIWENFIMYAKANLVESGKEWMYSRPKLSSKVLTKRGEVGVFIVGENQLELET